MPSSISHTRSAEIRSRLDHPIVDADGHLTEFGPAFVECVREVGGPAFFERFTRGMAERDVRGSDWAGWGRLSWQERRDRRARRGAWWGQPTRNTLDAATAALPGLLRARLDELGIDLVISYGGLTLYLPLELDEELRRVTVRALNLAQSRVYAEHADRIIPAAAIPMFDPREALEELDYAVGELGHKVIMIPTGVPRPIPALHRRCPDAFPEACWVDHYALDSEFDYDPFWARCAELGVAVSAHGGVLPNLPWYGRSISSFVHNHVGNHAHGLGLLCKSLFLGGVPRRFPRLHFAFLEGGVSWAVAMFSELVGAWDRRNLAALENTDPANLDREHYLDLVSRYGGALAEGKRDLVAAGLDRMAEVVPPESRDEWAALRIERREELRDLFAANYYFGCEADDPITACAFDARVVPFGARLRAVFGSDIGHYDVPDMARVVEEAWELVERGLLDEESFRDFAFGNAVRLHGGMNPDFFRGTSVESHAKEILQGAR